MKDATINVLGETYNVTYTSDTIKYPLLLDCNGYIDFTTKNIYVRNAWDEETMDNMDMLIRKFTRHEIIHAFLYESGLSNDSKTSRSWATNEEMVDWIAIQFPKMEKVFKELGVSE